MTSGLVWFCLSLSPHGALTHDPPLLPDMIMWHFQQVAPRRSGLSVTVAPPEVQIPAGRVTPRAPAPLESTRRDLFLHRYRL